MSIYAQINEDGPQDQVASNRGWGDFGRWVESLPAGESAHLRALWDVGVSEQIPALREEMRAALNAHSPDKDTTDVGQGLLGFLVEHAAADDILLITNGMQPGNA